MAKLFHKYIFYLEILITIFVFVLSTLFKLIPSLNYNFDFTFDQGRDMIVLRDIVVGHHLTLIGPTTSISGVFLGPFWFYFNIIPFILGRGDPALLTYWLIFWYQLSAIAIFFVFKKFDRVLAFITTIVFLSTPAFFYSSRYFWNANGAPLGFVFYFLVLMIYLKNNSYKKGFILGIISGLPLQLEAAIGILALPFSIIIILLLKGKRFKNLLAYFLGFSLTLLPQIIFDIKNHFLMSKNFINEFTNRSHSLGSSLGIGDTFRTHIYDFFSILVQALQIKVPFYYYLLLLMVVVLFFLTMIHKFNKRIETKIFIKELPDYDYKLFIVSFSFILLSFIFILFYRFVIYDWYLTGLYVPFVFIISIFFTLTLRLRNLLIKLASILTLVILLFSAYSYQLRFFPKSSSKDRSILANELADIDWVYKNADGQGFKAYNYVPAVYDFNYQYLYWWYGTKKYGYQPFSVSYLDNVPQYIPDNNLFWHHKRSLSSKYPIFLIIEQNIGNPQFLYAWRGNFTKYCSVKSKNFIWSTKVEELKGC